MTVVRFAEARSAAFARELQRLDDEFEAKRASVNAWPCEWFDDADHMIRAQGQGFLIAEIQRADRREELAKSYDEAEVATRVHGTPMLGAGPIFPVFLLPGLTRWFDKSEIPPWARHVVGIDFGFAHPFAAVWLAWTPDTQQYWVIDCFKMTGAGASDHVRRIHGMTEGLRIKLVSPHDGGMHDKGSGVQLIQQYKAAGANVAGKHITNYSGGLTLEPSIQEISAAMRDGKIVFNKSCEELLSELRIYHRDAKTGKAVDKNDDLVAALRYCFMGRRLGQPLAEYTGIGYGNLSHSHQQPQRGTQQYARGIDDWNVFDG